MGEEFKVGKRKLADIYIFTHTYIIYIYIYIYINMNQKRLTSSVGQRWLSADDFQSST